MKIISNRKLRFSFVLKIKSKDKPVQIYRRSLKNRIIALIKANSHLKDTKFYICVNYSKDSWNDGEYDNAEECLEVLNIFTSYEELGLSS